MPSLVHQLSSAPWSTSTVTRQLWHHCIIEHVHTYTKLMSPAFARHRFSRARECTENIVYWTVSTKSLPCLQSCTCMFELGSYPCHVWHRLDLSYIHGLAYSTWKLHFYYLHVVCKRALVISWPVIATKRSQHSSISIMYMYSRLQAWLADRESVHRVAVVDSNI